jgi:putative peptidoglycan lipid II flippase
MFSLTANPAGNRSVLMILKLMPPVVLGLIFASARTWADMRFGSQIGEGAYTCLDFARRIPDMLLQTLAMAVSVVVYPFLSEWALRGEKDKLADALVTTTRALAFVFIPISVGLMLVALPVIRLIYQHGQFSPQQAELSALGVYWYAPGLFFSALDAPINHWFFALKDTTTPNLMGVIFVVVHVLTGYVGVFRVGRTPRQQLSWVAAALTISKTGKVVALYGLIRRRIGRVDTPRALLFAGRLAVCVAAMALALWATERQMTPVLEVWKPSVKVGALASMAASCGVGTVVFLVAAALLRMEEISIVGDMARRGLRKVAGKLGAKRGA